MQKNRKNIDNNLDAKWLKEVRQRMSDRAPSAPEGGWERLLAELTATTESRSRRRTMFVWLLRAAAVFIPAIIYFIAAPNTSQKEDIKTAVTKAIHQTTDSIHSVTIAEKKTKARQEPLVAVTNGVSSVYEEVVSSEEVTPDETPDKVDTIYISQTDTVYTKPNATLNPTVFTAHEQQDRPSLGWNLSASLSGNGLPSLPGTASVVQGAAPEGVIETFNPVSPTDYDVVFNSKNHRSWSIGLLASKQITRLLSVESGLVYTQLTSDVITMKKGRTNQMLQYIGVPLHLQSTLWHPFAAENNKNLAFYATCGPMLELCLSAKRGGSSIDVPMVQWSVDVAVGVQYLFSRHAGLYIEPGVRYFFAPSILAPTTRTKHPLSLNLQFGLRLTY